MKLSHFFALSAISLSVYADGFFDKDQKEPTPIMRQYKDNETGMMYTFSRVNISNLTGMNVFRTKQNYTDSGNDITLYKNKNFNLEEANQFTFTYLQALNAPDVKVFFDLDYLHADGRTHVSYPAVSGTFPISNIEDNQLFNSNILVNNSPFAKITATFASHFDLVDTQMGASKRFYRSKNIDFTVKGGVDLDVFNFSSKLTSSQLDQDADGVGTGEFDYTQTFKSRYYGAGPLVGAVMQVPFAHDSLRLNIQAEGSLLMGYGSSYTTYESYAEDTYGSAVTYVNNEDRQRHTFRMVPTLRAMLSLDIIISNLIISGGVQQAVYFQAFDMNPLFDLSEFSGDQPLNTRSRLGQITTGGPFVKLSWLF